MNLVETKLLVSILLCLIRFFFGILPIKVYHFLINWSDEGSSDLLHAQRHAKIECIVARFQSFGGGVLFATCFLHMIPEVRKSVNILFQYIPNYDASKPLEFPFSELIVCLGFFMVYFIEEFTHWFVHLHQGNKTVPSTSPIKYIDLESNTEKTYEKELGIKKIENLQDFETLSNCVDYIEISDENSDEVILPQSGRSRASRKSFQYHQKINAKRRETEAEIKMKITEKEKQKDIRGLLVVIALSLHSIFEGLSIGLQKSTGNIWYMFIAISIHASTILYCIGFEMAIEGIRTCTIVINMVILACVSPLGIIIGLLFTLRSDMDTKAKTLAVCFLEGISAGTVLYITFFEVLNREKNRRQHRISRSICMLVGFFLMLILQIVDV